LGIETRGSLNKDTQILAGKEYQELRECFRKFTGILSGSRLASFLTIILEVEAIIYASFPAEVTSKG
jgi:hypothetical protein